MEPFPEDVARFLDSHVESIDQLEILRVLAEDPTREWTADTLASMIQTEPRLISGHLSALRSRDLLSTERRAQEVVYRYNPAGPDLAVLVSRVLQLYQERPVSMIRLVYAQDADPVRALANAFRLRKDGG